MLSDDQHLTADPPTHGLRGAIGTTDLRRLRLFVELARDPHFGRTARRQHVSQPTLSAQIKRLEQELGVRLFERDGRGSRLSSAGRALLPGALELLEHAERFNASAGVAGRVRTSPERCSREGPVPGAAVGGVDIGYSNRTLRA